jgi:hypothetical protein
MGLHSDKSETAFWTGGAFLVALSLAAAVLVLRGTGHDGAILGLKLTARWSYLLFLLAYVGGPLSAIFGPVFKPLARRGRDFGLAFASAHLAHLGLVAWIYHISIRPPISTESAVIFSVGAVITYLLALFSFPRTSAMLPPLVLRMLRTVGMDYIALIFLRDFLQNPFGRGLTALVLYLPFIVVGSAAVLVRLLAYAKRLLLRPDPVTAPRILRSDSSSLR